MPRHFLVIPAAGSGRRMQQDLPKQFLTLHGKTLLQHTLERMADSQPERIVLAAAADSRLADVLDGLAPALRALIQVVPGGEERMFSVHNAVESLAGSAAAQDWILVHDAVRPCVRTEDVRLLLESIRDEPAGGLLACPVRDTLKRADASSHVAATVERSGLWQAATPQAFRHGVLLQALRSCAGEGYMATDEAAAVERLGYPVKLVQGHADNIKLTWPEDLTLLDLLLRARAGSA